MSIYELEVTLRHISPPIWRRVRVPSDLTLAELHVVLQEALGWTDSHLHQFDVDGRSFGVPDPDGPAVEDERRVRLADVAREGSKLVYEYDFGDGWEHDVIVARVVQGDDCAFQCTDGRRACPPEDCGGPPGYESLLAALANPDDPEHDEMREWIGGEFDPQEFDLEVTNANLQEATAAMRRRRARKAKPKPRLPAMKAAND